MKNIKLIAGTITVTLLAAVLFCGCKSQPPAAGDTPLMLDVSKFYREFFVTAQKTNLAFVSITGKQVIDGLPFDVRGRGCLFGEREYQWKVGPIATPSAVSNQTTYPDFIGLPVGRAFDELNVLHACRWQEVEGQTIANIRLNYTDGTKIELPVRYGGQVRDWQRLRSEEKETLADPNSKIVWRGPGIPAYKSTTRLFKSRFENPYPMKTVATIDFVSTHHLASYDIVAATVANRDAHRPVTPAAPANEPERHFDGTCRILVTDADSDRPLADVLVNPGMDVDDTGVVASPVRTDKNGKAIIRYPKGRMTSLSFSARRDGYQAQGWSKDGEIPEQVKLQLKPATQSGMLAQAQNSKPVTAAEETDPVARGLKTLVEKIQEKLKAGQNTEASLAEELKGFDDLIAKNPGAKPDVLAQVVLLKAMLYLQVFEETQKGAALLQKIKTDYPGSKVAAKVDGMLAQIAKQDEAKKVQAALAPGAVFPDFNVKSLTGQPLSVAALKGKVVLVDFWATWCGPCRAELPNVIAIYSKFHGKGFEVIGVSLDSDRDKLDAFLKKQNGMTWPQFFDGQGWSNALAVKYGVESIPFTVLIGPGGKIIGTDLRGAALESAVAAALAKP